MTADRLERFLADLRNHRPDLPPMPNGSEEFTGAEAGRLLGGIGQQAIAAFIRRHQLIGHGQGKARRYPRATVDTLRALKDRGFSSQTSNHYLQAVHQFADGWPTMNALTEAHSPD